MRPGSDSNFRRRNEMKKTVWLLIAAVILSMVASAGVSAGEGEADGSVHSATDRTFKNEVLRAGVPVLCVFSAEWCKYCKKLKPVLKEIAHEYKGKVKVVVVDSDKSPDYCDKYDVEGIPALFMHDSTGSVTGSGVGYMDKERIVQKFGLDKL